MKKIPKQRHGAVGQYQSTQKDADATALKVYKHAFETTAADRDRLLSEVEVYKHAFETTAADRDRLLSEVEVYKHAFETTVADRDRLFCKCLWLDWEVKNRVHLMDPLQFLENTNILETYRFISGGSLPTLGMRSAFLSESCTTARLDGLLIGAEKSGTSFFYTLVREHPSFYVGNKDVDLFRLLESSSNAFENVFLSSYRGERFVVPFDAAFVCNKHSAQLLSWRAQGAIKVIVVILRDPIERAISEYRMRLRQGVEFLSFQEAVAASAERKKYFPNLWLQHWAYLERGLYWSQLAPYVEMFGHDALMVRMFERDLVLNPGLLLREFFARFSLAPPYGEVYETLLRKGGKESSTRIAPTEAQLSVGVTEEKLIEWLSYVPRGRFLEELKVYFNEEVHEVQRNFQLQIGEYWPNFTK